LVQTLGLDTPARLLGQFAHQSLGWLFIVFDTPAEQIPCATVLDRAGTLTEQELAGSCTINHCPGAALGHSRSGLLLSHIGFVATWNPKPYSTEGSISNSVLGRSIKYHAAIVTKLPCISVRLAHATPTRFSLN